MKYLILPLLTLVLSCEPMKLEDPKGTFVVAFKDGNKDTLLLNRNSHLYQQNLLEYGNIVAYDVKYIKELPTIKNNKQ